jgi:hypothetical protein
MQQGGHADQKQQHVSVCEELYQVASDNATFLSRVITSDESWLYSYDPETTILPVENEEQRRVFTKTSSWQAKLLIPHATVMFYGDCMKICKDLDPNFGDKRIGFCITTMHHLTLPPSSREFFTKKQHDCCPPPILLA